MIGFPNRRAAMFQTQQLVLDYVRDRQVPVMLDRNAAKQLVSDPQLQDAAADGVAQGGKDLVQAHVFDRRNRAGRSRRS